MAPSASFAVISAATPGRSGFGGTQRLARVVGKAMALELITTGRQMKADEALRIGSVNHVVPADKLLEKRLEFARMVAARGPVAVTMSKHLVQRGPGNRALIGSASGHARLRSLRSIGRRP